MKFPERVQKAREAFDLEALQEICMAPQSYFEKYGSEFKQDAGKGGFAFYFRDNESDILAVAHMDSVQEKRDFGFAKFASGKEIIFCPQLDDRLGVYTICEWLPKLGIKTDILLTTDEEMGKSTGGLLVTDKKYKWMFQFDRMGDDVVMYQYKTPEAVKKLEDCHFKVGMGSASDISKMSSLGCLGFNFGIGYEDAHSKNAWADLKTAIEQVARFTRFHAKYSREFMAYDKTKSHTAAIVHYYGDGESGYSYSSMHKWTDQYESDFGRRVNGIWYDKLIYDEKTRLFVVNQALYKHHPDSKPVSDQDILRKNTKWDQAKRESVLSNVQWTEKETIDIARGLLLIIGQDQPSLPEHPKGSIVLDGQVIGSTDADSADSTGVAGSAWDIDDPCECSHSRFVHRRMVWRGGVRYHDACDFWQCKCFTFRKFTRETASDILLGGF